MAQVTAAIGRADAVAGVTSEKPGSATVIVRCERGTAKLEIALEPDHAHRITGLLVVGVTSGEANLTAIVEALKALPGSTAFAVADVSGAKPRLTIGLESDTPLAIGSTFKLVILAELVRQIAAGRRHWNDMVTLDGTELPAGAYAQTSSGTKISVRDLTAKMISVSDNSAADILLATVGRKRVEAMQRDIGIARPGANIPFLSTMEAFKLKAIAKLGDRWLAADEKGRRELLTAIDATPGAAIGPLFADGRPSRSERIEWFMSPADLVRVMNWLRRHTESGPAAEARTLLATNPGIAGEIARRYDFVGYKGGSEPGVISMTVLLKNGSGEWQVITGTWNDPSKDVNQARFVALMTRAAEIASER